MGIEVREHVYSCKLDGLVVILDLYLGAYYGLDEVGSIVWAAIEAGTDEHRLLDELSSLYDVPRERLEQDILQVMSTLVDLGVVRLSD